MMITRAPERLRRQLRLMQRCGKRALSLRAAPHSLLLRAGLINKRRAPSVQAKRARVPRNFLKSCRVKRRKDRCCHS